MTTREHFRHDRSRYERPTLGWRCGRASLWGRPCERGPSVDGICGRGDKGCRPRRTLAVWRGRLSLIAAAFSIALVAVLMGQGEMHANGPSSLDPGPLSAAHAHFAKEAGCATCHAAHGQGAAGWWRAFWGQDGGLAQGIKPARGTEGMCLDCHGFGGREQLAHNQVFDKRADLPATDCLMCHTEHRGHDAAVSVVTDTQCQTCHTRKVHDFARDHPPFPPGFPHDHAHGVRFDHASHMAKHFADPRLAKLVPEGGCIGCHQVQSAGRTVRPAGFETACAGCHSEGIARRDFVMFRWPEIEKSDIAVDDVAEACGVRGDSLASLRKALEVARRGETVPASKPEEFSAVSVDPPTSLAAYLLGVPADDPGEYGKPFQDLLQAVLRDGADPFVKLAGDRLGKAPEGLFAGFNAEMARQAACAWAANREYEPPGTATLTGWRGDALDLRYAKPAHADPILRAWIEVLASAPAPAAPEDSARLAAVRKELLSADGPGQCLKCHTTSGPAAGPVRVTWSHALGEARPFTRFDHRAHVSLLGPEKTCTTCHKLGATAPAASAFQPIALETCTTCHAAGRVRADCQLCHVYHQDHALLKRMMPDAK